MIALATGGSTGQILRSIELSGAIVSTVHYPAGECALGEHYHENPHFCLLLRGADVESRGGASYHRRTGDLYFYHAGESHATRSRQRISANALIEFDGNILGAWGLSEAQLASAAKENLNAAFLMLKMQQELATNDLHSRLAIEALVLELVHHSKRRYAGTRPPWVQRVSDALAEQWDQRLTLTELAGSADVHPVTISRSFRKHFGCTLGEYRRQLMVKQSIPLIRDSDRPLSEIAHRCAFADQSHFTRTFHELTGFRPSDFRRF